jgi:hypothetical protein
MLSRKLTRIISKSTFWIRDATNPWRDIMSLSFIIEIGGKPVGLVHRYDRQEPFRFIASDRRLEGLEGQTFSKPVRAEAAARAWLAAKKKHRQDSRQNVLHDERSGSFLSHGDGALWA